MAIVDALIAGGIVLGFMWFVMARLRSKFPEINKLMGSWFGNPIIKKEELDTSPSEIRQQIFNENRNIM